MKKLTLIFSFVGLISFSSCTKTYQCDCGGVITEYEDLDKDEAEKLEATCVLINCDWSKK